MTWDPKQAKLPIYSAGPSPNIWLKNGTTPIHTTQHFRIFTHTTFSISILKHTMHGWYVWEWYFYFNLMNSWGIFDDIFTSSPPTFKSGTVGLWKIRIRIRSYVHMIFICIPRNLQQDLLNGPLNLSITHNSSNLVFGVRWEGPIQFLMECREFRRVESKSPDTTLGVHGS